MEVKMPELPEIKSRAKEMNQALAGRIISGVEVLQPKSLNIPEDAFRQSLIDAQFLETDNRGKWIFNRLTHGWLLINLGMGGEILLNKRNDLPEKYRLVFDLDDGSCLTINFWWFGYVHFVPSGELATHKMTAKLGPNADQVSLAEIREILKGRRGGIKSLLLDQSKIAGIGNAYIHDILFIARLHPLRTVDSLSEAEVEALHRGVQEGLQSSIEKGGAFYETSIFGKPGKFNGEDILIGYKEGNPCPICNTPIEKIKTGSTASYICPTCQAI
jgi:formamidopyrimidine-DNA glycosylase